jgi:hypothetical protein
VTSKDAVLFTADIALHVTAAGATIATVQATGLDPAMIAANIESARARKKKALTDYEAASAELAWWMKGAELAGLAAAPEDDEPEPKNVEEMFPPGAYFDQSEAQPSLRQAVVAFLREHPGLAFPVSDIAAALVLRGWLNEEGSQKRVSDIASLMHGDEQLHRVDRGVYRLHPRLAVAFERQPVTDYRQAAAMGMPVPQSLPPSSSGGDQK